MIDHAVIDHGALLEITRCPPLPPHPHRLILNQNVVYQAYIISRVSYMFCLRLHVIRIHGCVELTKWILKHLREFVQSDWFLPVFISHYIDTARGAIGMFSPHTHT